MTTFGHTLKFYFRVRYHISGMPDTFFVHVKFAVLINIGTSKVQSLNKSLQPYDTM